MTQEDIQAQAAQWLAVRIKAALSTPPAQEPT
jgi:hypothetical protein